ncbi:GNAT family N-acetyltransferase [Frisingicoccus sp.]
MELVVMESCDISTFKKDIQKAFYMGAIEGGYKCEPDEVILPEKDIDESLNKAGAVAYKLVDNNEIIGGAIVNIDSDNNKGYLDLLYVKYGCQSKGVGKFIWFEIERLNPTITTWGTCTPYFEKRNIHFYLNVCGFYIVKYFREDLPESNKPEGEGYFDDGMFEFEKVIKS